MNYNLDTNNINNRKNWIDVLKGIGIIFVIIGHLVDYNSFFVRYIFSFHMPLFFFISGYCFNKNKFENMRAFIRKRANKRLVPYFSFCLLGFVFTIISHALTAEKTDYYLAFMQTFLFAQPESIMVGQVWFLMCLFVTEIMFFFILTKSSNRAAIIAMMLLSATVGQLFAFRILDFRLGLKMDVAFTALVFYGTGYVLSSTNYFKGKTPTLALPVLLFLNVFFGPYLNGGVNICDIKLNNPVYYFISAFSGIAFCFCVAKLISQNRALQYIGRNTLVIFATHSLVINLIFSTANTVTNKSLQMFKCSALDGFLVAVLVILLEIPVVFMFNKYLPFVKGISGDILPVHRTT